MNENALKILLLIAVCWAFVATLLNSEQSTVIDSLSDRIQKERHISDSLRDVTNEILYIYDTIEHIDTVFLEIEENEKIYFDSIRRGNDTIKQDFVSNYLRQFRK